LRAAANGAVIAGAASGRERDATGRHHTACCAEQVAAAGADRQGAPAKIDIAQRECAVGGKRKVQTRLRNLSGINAGAIGELEVQAHAGDVVSVSARRSVQGIHREAGQCQIARRVEAATGLQV
jgi:hypothetical protein